MSHSLEDFGPIRSTLWPIYSHELRKVLPMLFMLFFICFNYSILRNMKDSLVVTASGAAVIPFIKVWVMLPTAVLLTFVFARLSNKYSLERVFYIMISMFLIFFTLFAFVLHPLRDYLHPTAFAASLQTSLPAGLRGMISMCCNWSFTIFYVMCELWSTSILTVLFWGFANEITTVVEARRFYGVLGVGASCAAIIAGQTANFFASFEQSAAYTQDEAWGQIMRVLIALVVVCGIVTMAIFRWMSRRVLTDPCFDEFHDVKKIAREKSKLSIIESFSYLSNSKYLICIAILVVAYNLVINMTEVLWKDQLSRLYPSPQEYNIYMNNLTSAIGVCATLTALFMARIINRLGWTRTAIITPLMMALTSIGFFSFFLFQDHWAISFPAIMAGGAPLVIAVFFGAAQNCLSKAAKYSVFDATKEMSFIPLSYECKLKGKAAIDGVGSRIGKSGGSLMYQGLLMFFGTISASAPYVACILAVVLVLWMIAVRVLGRQFNDLVASQEAQKVHPTSKEFKPKPQQSY